MTQFQSCSPLFFLLCLASSMVKKALWPPTGEKSSSLSSACKIKAFSTSMESTNNIRVFLPQPLGTRTITAFFNNKFVSEHELKKKIS